MSLLQVGEYAPIFTATNLTGSDISLEGYIARGMPIVLVFTPDRINPSETQSLKTLYEKRDNRIELITVTRKVPSVAMAKGFFQQLGVTFPIIYDQKTEICRMYGVDNPVAVFVIDGSGHIASSEWIDPKRGYIQQVQNALSTAPNTVGKQVQCPNCRGFKVKGIGGGRYTCDICGFRWEHNPNDPPVIGANPNLLQLGAEHLKRVEEEEAERKRAAEEAAAAERRQQEAAAAAWLLQQQQKK